MLMQTTPFITVRASQPLSELLLAEQGEPCDAIR
jgi:hypothetical protein